jgi:hypothetical protein
MVEYTRRTGADTGNKPPEFDDCKIAFGIPGKVIEKRITDHIKEPHGQPVKVHMGFLQYQFHRYQKYKN